MPARLLKSQSTNYTTRNSEGQPLNVVVDEGGFVCVCVCSSCFGNTYFFGSDKDILFLRRLFVLSEGVQKLRDF